MTDGTHTYYTLQHRRTHESPWLKPDGPLRENQQKEWHFNTWDHITEPWAGSGNNWKPKYPKSQNETHNVWAKTGNKGWWTLKYAVRALKRVRKASEEGKLNSKDGYGKVHQALRYEFRIVKMTVSQKTEVVSCEDLLEVLQ